MLLLHQTHMHSPLPHIHHLIHLQAPWYLVGDENHRHLALEAVDRVRKMFGGLLVQVGDGFVENQHPGRLSKARAMAMRWR